MAEPRFVTSLSRGCRAMTLPPHRVTTSSTKPLAIKPDDLSDIAYVGLSLGEAKLVLAAFQQEIVAAQVIVHAIRRPACRWRTSPGGTGWQSRSGRS